VRERERESERGREGAGEKEREISSERGRGRGKAISIFLSHPDGLESIQVPRPSFSSLLTANLSKSGQLLSTHRSSSTGNRPYNRSIHLHATHRTAILNQQPLILYQKP
jgi:hypothetical protein